MLCIVGGIEIAQISQCLVASYWNLCIWRRVPPSPPYYKHSPPIPPQMFERNTLFRAICPNQGPDRPLYRWIYRPRYRRNRARPNVRTSRPRRFRDGIVSRVRDLQTASFINNMPLNPDIGCRCPVRWISMRSGRRSGPLGARREPGRHKIRTKTGVNCPAWPKGRLLASGGRLRIVGNRFPNFGALTTAHQSRLHRDDILLTNE